MVHHALATCLTSLRLSSYAAHHKTYKSLTNYVNWQCMLSQLMSYQARIERSKHSIGKIIQVGVSSDLSLSLPFAQEHEYGRAKPIMQRRLVDLWTIAQCAMLLSLTHERGMARP